MTEKVLKDSDDEVDTLEMAVSKTSVDVRFASGGQRSSGSR